jgi:hypothetical protein
LWLFGVAVKTESLRNLPDEDLSIIRTRSDHTVIERVPARISTSTRPLIAATNQSVSNTAAVCPRNNGICSGRRPLSFNGMTANAPPPLASQFTDRYSGLAYHHHVSFNCGASRTSASNLDQIGIPGISGDSQVIVTSLLLRGFSEDMSCCVPVSTRPSPLTAAITSGQSQWHSRYFDARTNRPDIWAHALVYTDQEGRAVSRGVFPRKWWSCGFGEANVVFAVKGIIEGGGRLRAELTSCQYRTVDTLERRGRSQLVASGRSHETQPTPLRPVVDIFGGFFVRCSISKLENNAKECL